LIILISPRCLIIGVGLFNQGGTMSGYRIIELVLLFVIGVYFFIPCYAWYKEHSQTREQTAIGDYSFHRPIKGKQPFHPQTQVNWVLKGHYACRNPHDDTPSMPFMALDDGCQNERL
jgi:hypothetical protein